MVVKKLPFLVLGFVGLGLGFVGVVLPLIPAFPFLMLAAYSFARCSERLDRWFRGTRLYRDNLEDLVGGRGMTRAARRRVMGAVALVMAVGFTLMALKGLLEGLHQPQVVKVVFEALAHQKLHGKVVDLLFAPGVVFGVAPLALGAQKVPQHDGARLVELLVKGVFRLHRHFGAKLCYNLLVNRVLGYNITNQTHFCDTPFFEEK